eukprot:763421-Hanusia_phi.AAC.3
MRREIGDGGRAGEAGGGGRKQEEGIELHSLRGQLLALDRSLEWRDPRAARDLQSSSSSVYMADPVANIRT